MLTNERLYTDINLKLCEFITLTMKRKNILKILSLIFGPTIGSSLWEVKIDLMISLRDKIQCREEDTECAAFCPQ